jgi:hypothetical protein
MMSNILIVESKNDKIFIEKLIEILNFDNIEIDEPICVDDYECLDGWSKTAIIRALKSLSASLPKKNITKIGIVIDQDKHTKEQKLNLINECVDQVFTKSAILNDVSSLIEVKSNFDISLQLGCYFTNVNQQGDLDTLLKAIKTQDSDYADCLESWRNCIKEQEKTISNEDFDKFWINNYIRFDTCLKKESSQAYRKCSMYNFDYILENKSHIFDFDNPVLDEIKAFLKLFKD